MQVTHVLRLVVVTAQISAPAFAASGSPVPIEGSWLTQDGGGVIDIEPCGSVYCGSIVGLEAASSGNPLPRDVNGHSRCGLQIIHGLSETDPGEWTGKITNPEDGQTYSARLSVDDQGQLHLRGYVVVPLFGQTQLWTKYGGRVSADCRMIPSERPEVLSERPP
jgi:uncharacterized protein (DUF2147 family)